jgi:hypothetical protein
MGVMDMAKMARQAMAARNKMSKIKAAGKHGSLAMAIDGLYNTTDVEIDRDELRAELGEVDDKMLDKIIRVFENNIQKASADTKKSLEKELAKSTSMEDLKSMLQ